LAQEKLSVGIDLHVSDNGSETEPPSPQFIPYHSH